jgi:hypothetical protein
MIEKRWQLRRLIYLDPRDDAEQEGALPFRVQFFIQEWRRRSLQMLVNRSKPEPKFPGWIF